MCVCVLLDISLCIINDSSALICASRVVCSFMVASPPTREHASFPHLVLMVSLYAHTFVLSPSAICILIYLPYMYVTQFALKCQYSIADMIIA